MNSTKRSRLLISLLQVRLMLLSVAYLLALALTLGATLFWPLTQRMDDAQLGSAERAAAAAELLALHARFWPAFAVVSATFVAHQLLVSHRIAGPLYRIRQVLRGMAHGDLPSHVRLRKRDLLSEEADELNALIGAWRTRLDDSRRSLERARAAAAQWSPGDAAGQREQKAELEGALSQLELELEGFDRRGSLRSEARATAEPPPALPRSSAPSRDVESASTLARAPQETES